jgi:FtsH-binding integral membrane protein
MIAFAIAALVTGVTIVFLLPWVQGQLARFPGYSSVASNRIAQVFIVGAIVVLGLGLFTYLTRRIKI